MSQFRAACFTINNPTTEELSLLDDQLRLLKYAVYQLERGENGTLHVQGYGVARKPKRLGGWKAVVGTRAHIESARGNAEQNRLYCTKEPRESGPFEFGTFPTPGLRTDIAGAVATVQEGASIAQIIEKHPEEFVKYHKGLLAVRLHSQPRRNWKTEVFWFYGPTGTGKSREANERYPDAYYKMPSNKWWDGYDGEDTVIVDDYRRDMCTFSELLRLFDRYPVCVETKGGSQQFLARTIVITTPKSPRDTWEGRAEEDIQQLLRRIEYVRHFPRLLAPRGGDAVLSAEEVDAELEARWARVPSFVVDSDNDA